MASWSLAAGSGQLSFCETIASLDVQPQNLGHDRTITFFNDWDQFSWTKPDKPCDIRSGVICSPNNFDYPMTLDDGTMRITALANFDYWNGLNEREYELEKIRWYDQITDSAVRFVPDYRSRVIDTDMFTPTTIVRFTGSRQRRSVRRTGKTIRRPHAPRESIRLRNRPRVCRHHWQHRQWYQHGEPALFA